MARVRGLSATIQGDIKPQQMAQHTPKSSETPYWMYGGDPAMSINGGNAIDQNQMHAEAGYDTNDNTDGPDRTAYGTLAPPGMERRVMMSSRVASLLPSSALAVSYAEQDAQKGGAPGSPGSAPGGNDPQAHTNTITSQGPTGITTPGGVPVSQMKMSFGASDWTSQQPTALPAHLKIAIAQNPNAAQRNVGLWAAEGQMANTKYTSPAPWAAGTFIG